MFCLNCGKEIPDNSAVCQFCGVAQPQAQQVPPQAPYGAPQQAPFNAPQQAPYGAPQQPPFGAPQQPFPSFAPPAPPTPTKKKNKTPMIIAIVVVVFILAGIGFTAEKIFQAEADSQTENYDYNEDAGLDSDYDIVENYDDSFGTDEFHVLEKQEEHVLTRFTYYCDGDYILGWAEENEMDIGGLSQDQIDAIKEKCYSEYETYYSSYDFVTHEVDQIGDTLIQTYIVTDVENNMDALVEIGILENANGNHISYTNIKDNWISQGYTEVEE